MVGMLSFDALDTHVHCGVVCCGPRDKCGGGEKWMRIRVRLC